MPSSLSQYRTSIGNYQNKHHDNFRKNILSTQMVNATTSNEVYYFGDRISRTINSHQELLRQFPPHKMPQPNLTLSLLMLLSIVRLTGNLPPEVLDTSAFMSSVTSSENMPPPNKSSSIFHNIINPISDIFYETTKFISLHDPLIFPGADATFLDITTKKTPRDIKNIIQDMGSIPPVEYKEHNITFLSNELTLSTIKIINDIENEQVKKEALKMLDKLNQIAIEAEEKNTLDSNENKKIDSFIHLIKNSKNIIDNFEIKYSQEKICQILRTRLGLYMNMASDLSDKKSAIKFKEYIESIPLLKFTPDKRGEGYPSIESQIASGLVRSFFWFENDQGHSAVYGHRYDAYKYLLTCLLAEKNIDNINKLPDTWYKGDEAIRLVNLLFQDLEYNLKNKGERYLIPAAEMLYLSLRDAYTKDSTFDIKGLEKKPLSSFSDEDKILALLHYLNQPVNIEYNQESNFNKMLKILDFLTTIQFIATFIRPKNLSIPHHHNFQPHMNIYGKRATKKIEGLHFEYNSQTHELTINPINRLNNRIHNTHSLQIQDLINENKKITKINFRTNPSLKSHHHHSYVSKEMRKKIPADMYEKNIKIDMLSPPDKMGLRYSKDGKSYLNINNKFVRIYHMKSHPDIKNRYFIRNENKERLYFRFKEDNKFHCETHYEKLEVIKKFGFGGKTSKITPPNSKLTIDEISALHGYGKVNAFDINDFMRAGSPDNYLPPFIQNPIIENIKHIKNALKKIPPHEGLVYRGTTISKKHFDSLYSGQIVTNKAFLSCSTDPAAAKLFTLSDSSLHSPIMYEFNIKKSGHSITDFTMKSYEKEILIENNQFFRIKEINKNRIILDEVDSSLLSHAEKVTAGSIDFEI